jgi:aromatic ring-opening dioxygenase catalytic subunit (LigB family)
MADAITQTSPSRMPVAFIPHGGGPWPFVDVGLGERSELDGLAAYLRSVKSLPKSKPTSLLVVSAHWEESVATLTTSPRPPILYDYYGFPKEAYEITWPAPGSPGLAARARALLDEAGFETDADPDRGFDHGTFIPLKVTYPEADIPAVQLSLKRGLDPAEHLAMGKALAPLRDEGVFIVGSGMSFHNLRAFSAGSSVPAAAFDDWLRQATTQDEEARNRALCNWTRAPSAREAHPREEHLLPLMVVAGAAGKDRASVAYNGTIRDLKLSAFHFG